LVPCLTEMKWSMIITIKEEQKTKTRLQVCAEIFKIILEAHILFEYYII
jgi:hypothetical protein